MAITYDLTTYIQAKVYMKIPVANTDNDVLLTVLVSQVSRRIAEYLNRIIPSNTYTDEKYDGTGYRKLFTLQYPITTLSEIKSYDPHSNTDLYTYTVNDEYILHRDQEYIIKWTGWQRGTQNFKITYTAGYTTIPPDIVLACNMLVALTFNSINSENLKSWRSGTYSQTKFDTEKLGAGTQLPASIQSMLAIWRKRII